MDADLSHDVRVPARTSSRALDDGADVVIGSRNIPGGGVEGWGLGRHVISKGGSLYSRTILGLGVRDLTSGYKAFTRRALEAIDLDDVALERLLVPDRDDLPRAPPGHARRRRCPIVFVDRTRRALEDEPQDLRRGHRHGVEAAVRRGAREAMRRLAQAHAHAHVHVDVHVHVNVHGAT